jgi:ArsR family transcriptional regulator
MDDYRNGGAKMLSRKRKSLPCDPTSVTLPADDSADQLARLAWAVAHPARVRIVRLLLARQACVCGEIVDELPLAQSTVSQHLKILKESGLIQGEVDGPKVCYCINQAQLNELKRLIEKL